MKMYFSVYAACHGSIQEESVWSVVPSSAANSLPPVAARSVSQGPRASSPGSPPPCQGESVGPVFPPPPLFPKVKCPECNKLYSCKRSLNHHHKNVHRRGKSTPALVSSGVGALKCPVCGAIFSHRQSLGRHMEEHQSTPKSRHECKMCEKSYKRKEELRYHVSRKHN